jgi:uncharacterized OB-fold protein
MLTTARYWREQPQRYRMEAGKCTQCGTVYFPPRRVCSGCAGRAFETVVLPGTGTVSTFTVIHVAPTAFTDQAPYAVAIVKLADGTAITTQLVDCDPGAIEIGMPVRLEFRKIFGEGEEGVLCYGYKAVPS